MEMFSLNIISALLILFSADIRVGIHIILYIYYVSEPNVNDTFTYPKDDSY